MFSRKKPPQLSLLDELQQTYNDCCNHSIKNLSLEEENAVEESLKGWKSLHTSLLYKIDLFDKQAHKLSGEELNILKELKSIRDENVKHLIRLQLRMDEVNRRKYRDSSNATAAVAHKAASNSNLSVPSLRHPASRTSSSTSVNQQRSMLKSLRPGSNQGTSSASSGSGGYHLSKSRTTQASQAANSSWQKPKNHSVGRQTGHSYPNVVINEPPVTFSEDELFDDFDDEAFDFNNAQSESNWERIGVMESRTSSGISDLSSGRGSSSSNNNLIDLDEDDDDLVRSMDDMTIKTVPPPPPPSRHRANQNTQSVPKVNISNHSGTNLSYPNGPKSSSNGKRLDNFSKSTPDIRTIPSSTQPPPTSASKKPYVYNKPKPINVSQLMKKQSQNRLKPTKSPTKQPSAAKPTSQAPRTTQPAPPAQPKATTKPKAVKPQSTNISYNYVKPQQKAKSTTAKVSTKAASQTTKAKTVGTTIANNNKSSEAINSPTMDDLLSGYENDDEDVGTIDIEHKLLTDDEEQDLFISTIRGVDPLAAKSILTDIVVHGDEVYWDDLVGLESAKYSLKEAVVYPFLRPDLFRGLREPTRGMLLFGPPGTGKTMLARAVATESKSTFFSISASSLTSKYLGESEKLVKALFLLAKKLAPSIVFVDEIDSLLSSRTEGEVESTRRIKNEFLVQWSELSSAAAGRESDNDDLSRVLILGATNLPWTIDEAARRRFVRRQYIPLPEGEARKAQIRKLLKYQNNTLSDEDYDELMGLTEGFSGSDITALAKDSAMGPLRSLGDKLLSTPTDEIRPINLDDFKSSLKYIRPSVSSEGLEEYENWALKFGSSGA
ncbi:member of the AAA ATPase family of protein [Scheffersomyces xylosifermentans]|uniref:member of the AAA ATPase family of protein n=1 Tax=Scheffersomyces xylosifermentans TaxID=1304137 RepID=UPI00315D1D62